ncbi:protocadherin Fat 4-like [Ptychodera flava]|uniref:protocadherin Fat 4-like n=1 Tax=Ptychodera flava TaxID=63121 RepID=UPI00396A084E
MLLPPGGITAGTLVSFVSATDLDSGSNAEITYSVISEKYKDTFQISPNGAITVIEDYTPVTGVDDEILTFNISAKDGGSPPKEDTGMVVITFEKPSQVYEFNETRYEFSVLENEDSISVGTVVAFSRIENKGLFYELPYAIDEVVLDRQTGSVNITRPIDREATSKLTFNVLARGDDLLDGFAFTLVEIIIQDVNDEAPYFVHPQEPVLWTELLENSVNSSFVKFKAEDRDQEGPNSQIVYSIVDGNDDDIFLINDSTGDLSVIRGADRESVESYNMIIMAKDKGFPSLNATVAFNVLVLDENDNAPLITAESTIVTLNENTGTGIEVSYVAANDEDKGKNAEITFQLEEDSNGMFYVNEISGSIQTAQSLDRETEDTHTIKVIAVDGGTPEKTSTPVFITFVVEDYNDNAPEFVNPNYYVPLPKDSPPKTKVLMVSAVDRDIGINAVVTYDIIGGGNCSQNHFEINSTTGQILTADTLYSQPSGSCLLSIRCQDTGAEPLSSTTMIEINIEEVNFPPRFLSDSYWATVNEHSLIGTAVNTEPLNPPTATDDDIDANGEVFYDIVGGNDDELFSLDHLTGQINVNKPLDRETLASVELIISAHDVTPDPKSATVTLTITISDANDNAPELPQELNATITQGGSSGDTVTIVNARDPDLGKNTECFYHIARARFEGIGSVTPSDYFNINQTDGAITTTDNLYKLNLTSTISIEYVRAILFVRNIEPIVQGPYSATNVNPAASWLTVSFQYKYTPRCREDEYLIDVPEDMQIGESLNITIEPRQNGTKPLPSLFYEIKPSSSLNVFTIDVNTGEISVNNILDVGLYNLTIVVMTGDPENGKGSCTVLVDVYQVTTTVHTTMTPAPVEPCTEEYLLALIGVSAATIVLLIVLIAVCLTLHWRTRGKDNGAKTLSKSAKLSEADEVQSVCELPQRPNWMLMKTLPESENGKFLKSDPTEEIFTNKYIEMSIHPRAADYQQVEGAQPESGVYETTVQDNTDVDDDYLRPVHAQGTMPWLPDVDYD